MSRFGVWVIGYFKTEVNADTPEQAQELAETKINRELDTSDTFMYCEPDYDTPPVQVEEW